MPYNDDTFVAGLAVYTALQNEEGKVFLLRRINSKWRNGYYSLPAGRVEQGETFIEGAVREAEEEAGVSVKPEDLKLYAVINRHDDGPHPDWVDVFYKTQVWQGEAHAHETDKFDHGDWFALDDLPDNIIENQRDGLLQLQLSSNTIAQKYYNYLGDDNKSPAPDNKGLKPCP